VRRSRSTARGYSLIELAVVVALIAILAGLAIRSLSSGRPRASLAGAALELQTFLHQARQTALADAKPVAVLIFPNYQYKTQIGRVILYQDGNGDFFKGGTVNFPAYDPAKFTTGPNSSVIDSYDLPAGVVVGGGGAALVAPYADIPIGSCSFCTDRGAVRFDERGSATFWSGTGQVGTSVSPSGQSLSLQTTDPATPGQVTFVVTAGSGSVVTVRNQ